MVPPEAGCTTYTGMCGFDTHSTHFIRRRTGIHNWYCREGGGSWCCSNRMKPSDQLLDLRARRCGEQHWRRRYKQQESWQGRTIHGHARWYWTWQWRSVSASLCVGVALDNWPVTCAPQTEVSISNQLEGDGRKGRRRSTTSRVILANAEQGQRGSRQTDTAKLQSMAMRRRTRPTCRVQVKALATAPSVLGNWKYQ